MLANEVRLTALRWCWVVPWNPCNTRGQVAVKCKVVEVADGVGDSGAAGTDHLPQMAGTYCARDTMLSMITAISSRVGALEWDVQRGRERSRVGEVILKNPGTNIHYFEVFT